MLLFIARRIATSLLLLFAISFIVCGLLYLAPGSPESALLGHRPRDPAVVAHIRQSYHLDRSFLVQYGYWLWDALHLRFGRSIITSQTVGSVIADRAPVSFFL